MTKFIKGMRLCHIFFSEHVQPLLSKHFPDLKYAAGRLGGGSDVLGFDTEISRDHDWGPRLSLFLSKEDWLTKKDDIDQMLRHELPNTVRGYPTNYSQHEDGTLNLELSQTDEINHQVEFMTVRGFFYDYLRYDIERPLTQVDWLKFPQQRLRTIRHGRIFFDNVNLLSEIRTSLDYYPTDIWLYLMAAEWVRLSQDEAFVGRTAHVGDAIGSRILATSQIQNMMRLLFLIKRDYAPYQKWFGTGFMRLNGAEELQPMLTAVLNAQNIQERESALSAAYIYMGKQHNSLGITPHIEPRIANFHSRPYLVPHAGRFADALLEQVTDPVVQAWPMGLGGIDQVIDSTDVLSYPVRFSRYPAFFEEPETETSNQ